MNLAIVMSIIAYAVYAVFDVIKNKKVWLIFNTCNNNKSKML
jgi:hypothetical protein